jgi:hypothetical protein
MIFSTKKAIKTYKYNRLLGKGCPMSELVYRKGGKTVK